MYLYLYIYLSIIIYVYVYTYNVYIITTSPLLLLAAPTCAALGIPIYPSIYL